MITPTIRAVLDTFQQSANRGTAVYLSLELVQELRDALKAEPDADALAARPLLEQVAAMADCIGANTVGQITAISNRAAAWLRANPPGQPVTIEPRDCPRPGACSCVESTPPAPEPGELGELVELLKLAGRWATSTGVHLDRFAALFDHQEAELAALRRVPVAGISDERRDAVREAVAEALGNAYDCQRVWSAWNVGTMGQDDFTLTAEDDDRVAEIADAAIEAFRTVQVSAPQAGEAQS